MRITIDDVNILQECIQGNKTAQYQLYEMYRVNLFTVCLRYISNREEAEDRFQESWVKIFSKMEQYDEGKGSFYGWARRIVVNTCLEFLRKKKIYFDEIQESLIMPAHNADVTSDLSVQDMMRILNSLPTGYRTVFNLYVVEGYSHKEIAELLNISISTSKTQLMKAKALMRSKVSVAFAV